MGTFGYMAPEQALGKKDIGPAADVWTLGAILYECLTGRPPFVAGSMFDLTAQVVSEEPVPPRQLNPHVPRDLEIIAVKCLRKEPERRYGSASDLADDLARWHASEPIRARPTGRLERILKWARRRPAAAALLGVSLLSISALAGFAFLAFQQWQTATSARQQVEGEQEQRLTAQLRALCDAAPSALPGLFAQLESEGESILPDLDEMYSQERDPSRRRRLSLALLRVRPEHAAEHLDDLVGLVLNADENVYGLLHPVLVRHREQVVARLRRELTARPNEWHDPALDGAWKPLANDLKGEVEHAGGLFAERFALCQSLPLERLHAVADGLRPSRYRPMRVRPWQAEASAKPQAAEREGALVAVVWTRDGRDWALKLNLTADQAAVTDREVRARGLVPADVAGYHTPKGDRYALLSRQGEQGEQAAVHVGMFMPDHVLHNERLTKTGLVAMTVQGLLGDDGQARFAGVWNQGPRQANPGVLIWDRGEASHAADVLAAENLLTDVDVTAEAGEPPDRKWRHIREQMKRELAEQPANRLTQFRLAQAQFHLRQDAEALRNMDAALSGKDASDQPSVTGAPCCSPGSAGSPRPARRPGSQPEPPGPIARRSRYRLAWNSAPARNPARWPW